MKLALVLTPSPDLETALQKAAETIRAFISPEHQIDLWLLGGTKNDLRLLQEQAKGCHRLLQIADDFEENYLPERYLDFMTSLYEREHPDLMVFYGNIAGTELGVRFAARLQCGCCTNVQEFFAEGNGLFCKKRVYSSHLDAVLLVKDLPFVVTAAKGMAKQKAIFQGEKSETEIIAQPVLKKYAFVLKRERMEEQPRNPLETASLIFVGGKGLGNRNGFQKLEQVSALLHGASGATRPAALSGWTGLDKIIGQSGAIVGPELCVAVGVSGAAPFIAGVERAKLLVAVNQDPSAPIFSYADVGIIEDGVKLLDCLKQMAEHQQRRGKSDNDV